MNSWVGRSAAQIAEAVRSGETEPEVVVRQHLERIERLNPQLAAFRRIRHQEALAEAAAVAARPDLAELPLAGVPVAIKDDIEVEGEQTRRGSAATRTAVNRHDHPVVARLRDAGAIVVGLTNVPELCLTGMSDSVYGIVRNPWSRERTAGGSSGGSAAATSAALVPLAHGSDALGSIRLPAACCGLVGIKPGAEVVPPTLSAGERAWFGLADNGVLATTVRDAALALSVMADDPALAGLGEPTSPRIGVSVRNALTPGVPADARLTDAVVETGRLLEKLGHRVEEHAERYPAWLGPGIVRTWWAWAHQDARMFDPAQLERRSRRFAAAGRVLNTAHLDGGAARTRWRTRGAEAFFGSIDVLVLPALSAVPPAAQRYGERGVLYNTLANVKVATLFSPWNVAGWPAMSLPAGVHEAGTPIGVQLVARPGGERMLLELARQIEAARPWPRHAPEYRVDV
jgi:amidase